MKSSIILAAFGIVFSINASAQKNNGANHHCTTKGKQTCCRTITPKERMAIQRQQHDVRLAKKVAMSDGVVTRGERQIIRNEKQQVKRTINRANNNNRMR